MGNYRRSNTFGSMLTRIPQETYAEPYSTWLKYGGPELRLNKVCERCMTDRLTEEGKEKKITNKHGQRTQT